MRALKPSRRCRVCAGDEATCFNNGTKAESPASVDSSLPASRATDSDRRCAALPVGAASAMAGRAGNLQACACLSSINSMRSAVVVLPVPGPPVSTNTRAPGTAATAARCQRVDFASMPANNSSTSAASVRASSGKVRSAARARKACASRDS
jgi:hypothetical protein